MKWTVRQFNDFTSLPANFRNMLKHGSHLGLFRQPIWFEYMMKTLYSDKHYLRVYCIEDASGAPQMLMPLRYTRTDPSVRDANVIASVSHLENFAPAFILFEPDALPRRHELMVCLFRWLGQHNPSARNKATDVIRLWPFAADSQMREEVSDALREAGYEVQSYRNSANLYEDTRGISYEDYFKARSANHRYNCRRRQRNLEKAGDVEFEMYNGETDAGTLERAIDDYILVAAHSWKPALSNFSLPIINMIRVAHIEGDLRLSVLRLNGVAIAAQFWILADGVANNIRPNFRENFRQYAPGVVLTNLSIKHLLENDKVNCIDYGYGNDDYKSKWVSRKRNYFGIMAFNTRTPRGRYFGLKHIQGQKFKKFMGRMRKKLRRLLP